MALKRQKLFVVGLFQLSVGIGPGMHALSLALDWHLELIDLGWPLLARRAVLLTGPFGGRTASSFPLHVYLMV